MGTLIVPDEYKVSREEMLLGDVTATKTDCNGVQVEVHGLTGNDLGITIGGSSKSLEQAIIEAGGGNVDLSTSTVTTASGSTYTMAEVTSGLEEVAFTVQDLQTKYNNI